MENIIETAGIQAVIVIAAVEAIRQRVPSIDGWRVLVVAAAASLILGAIMLTGHGADMILEAARVSLFAWLIAVGGDAWASKLAGKSAGKGM